MTRYGLELAAILGLSAALSTGCLAVDAQDDLDLASAGEPADKGTDDEVDLGAEKALSCPDGSMPHRSGVEFDYWYGGNQFLWTVDWGYDGVVRYTNDALNGTYSGHGTITRWSQCPASPEPIQVIRSDGTSWSCTHNCLSGGREEIHCPHIQLLLKNRRYDDFCLAMTQATPTPTPTPTPVDCKPRAEVCIPDVFDDTNDPECAVDRCDFCYTFHCGGDEGTADFEDCVINSVDNFCGGWDLDNDPTPTPTPGGSWGMCTIGPGDFCDIQCSTCNYMI